MKWGELNGIKRIRMGGRLKHVIVSINPLGRLLYIRCARADVRFTHVREFISTTTEKWWCTNHTSFLHFMVTAKRIREKRARLREKNTSVADQKSSNIIN